MTVSHPREVPVDTRGQNSMRHQCQASIRLVPLEHVDR